VAIVIEAEWSDEQRLFRDAVVQFAREQLAHGEPDRGFRPGPSGPD
jgi:hypothetical protein